ncbi:MAG TPA: response regulator, partial [Lachnospiraceae bacterium]|nr:response regulator [Lachnospiraceae bacterium]
MTEVQNKATILAVDDSKANRMLMSKIFGEEYQVETAKDGIEAVKTLRSHPDTSLVILDIIMPRMDGYEIMEEMNKDPQLCNIPILVVTSSEETNSMLKALDMGAIDVIVKPLNPQIVLRRVRNIILRNSALKLQEQNKVYAQLLRQSEIDDLTGIYNKQAFCRMATQMLTNEPDEKYYIICCDIDRFKVFNDIYG